MTRIGGATVEQHARAMVTGARGMGVVCWWERILPGLNLRPASMLERLERATIADRPAPEWLPE